VLWIPFLFPAWIERFAGEKLQQIYTRRGLSFDRVCNQPASKHSIAAGGKMQSTESNNRLNTTWWALRVLFGFVPIAAGLDKFFNLLTNWEAYLNPLATKIVPVSPVTFMHIVGVIEIAAGIIVLSRFTRIGAYVVTLWLVAIALNLLVMGKFLDVAVRDLGLSVAAFSLAQLTAVREEGTSRIRFVNSQPVPVRP
jgi:uncharacterized membrane protein YphA (DoxX/SURF4 family)